ncbi:MAG: hypothetical protein K2H63_00760 [Paramuribaculum sp.]|nr:hypothetical protein [Paramuribaculum sp.]
MNIRNSFFLSLLIISAGVCRAQGYYDDDIYFNSSKDKDKNVELAKKQAEEAKKRTSNGYILYPVADYAAADTYAPEGSSTISVDEYNRRGIFGRDTVSSKLKSGELQDFAYTRQIEKYYNPAIVVGSDDAQLADLYYAQPANVNIYVNTPSYGYWGYPYSWGGWYDPWYSGYWGYNYWGPAWSWGPSWSWGPAWSWGPSWSWGPAWSWGPSWSWAPARPYNPRHPGVTGHSRPSYGVANRPGSNSHFNNNGYRPAYNSNRHNGAVSRPAYNGNSNSNNRDNNSYSRPGRNNNSNNSYRNNSNNNSYRSNSGSYRSSGGSFNSGGSRSSGGGRGRH